MKRISIDLNTGNPTHPEYVFVAKSGRDYEEHTVEGVADNLEDAKGLVDLTCSIDGAKILLCRMGDKYPHRLVSYTKEETQGLAAKNFMGRHLVWVDVIGNEDTDDDDLE